MTHVDDPTLVQPAAAAATERCATCGAPMAPDQRYCLECGTRRAEARVPYATLTGAPVEPLAPVATVVPARPLPLARLGGPWGVAALLLVALGVGVLLGRLGRDEAPVIAQRAPVVNISGGGVGAGTAGSGTVTAGSVTDQWPTGRKGFTIQLQELPKTSTDQATADAARTAAAGKGAADVGVLDGDAHGLTAGTWVVYSGVFATRAEARAKLDAAKAAFPDATVVAVAAAGGDGGDTVSTASSDSAGSSASSAADAAAATGSSSSETVSKSDLAKRSQLSGDDFAKQSKKLPSTVGIGGKPPAKDNGTPGGGTDAETIG